MGGWRTDLCKAGNSSPTLIDVDMPPFRGEESQSDHHQSPPSEREEDEPQLTRSLRRNVTPKLLHLHLRHVSKLSGTRPGYPGGLALRQGTAHSCPKL